MRQQVRLTSHRRDARPQSFAGHYHVVHLGNQLALHPLEGAPIEPGPSRQIVDAVVDPTIDGRRSDQIGNQRQGSDGNALVGGRWQLGDGAVESPTIEPPPRSIPEAGPHDRSDHARSNVARVLLGHLRLDPGPASELLDSARETVEIPARQPGADGVAPGHRVAGQQPAHQMLRTRRMPPPIVGKDENLDWPLVATERPFVHCYHPVLLAATFILAGSLVPQNGQLTSAITIRATASGVRQPVRVRFGCRDSWLGSYRTTDDDGSTRLEKSSDRRCSSRDH